MKKLLRVLNIKGYTLNYNVHTDIPNSVFYDNNVNEDEFIQTIEDPNGVGYIIIYTQDASNIKATIYIPSGTLVEEISNMENFIYENMPESMKNND